MGKGSSNVTVSQYYTGLQFILGHGPFDKITNILVSKKTLFEGNATTGPITLNKPELFGGESREGGIVGELDLDFGEPTQPVNSYLASVLGANIPAFRGLMTLVFKKGLVGNNYYLKPWVPVGTRIHKTYRGNTQWQDALSEIPRTQDITGRFVSLDKDPTTPTKAVLTFDQELYPEVGSNITVSGANETAYNGTFTITSVNETVVNYTMASEPTGPATGTISVVMEVKGLMNAVHMLREMLVHPVIGYGYSPGKIDEANWAAAAQTCYDEGLGFAFYFSEPMKKSEIIDEISKHIQGYVYEDRLTGLYKINLVRKIADPNTLPLFDSSNTFTINKFRKTNLTELASIVELRYVSNITFQEDSVTLQDLSLYQKQDFPVEKTVTYKGVADVKTAALLAARDLRQLSTPVYSCTIQTNLDAEFLNKGDAFRLYRPDKIDKVLVLRIIGMDLGDAVSQRITLTCVEDLFYAADVVYDLPEGSIWKDPITAPQAMDYRIVTEIPYYLVARREGDLFAQNIESTSSYLMVAGVSPSPDSISANVWTTTGATFKKLGFTDFCGTGTLVSNIDKQTTVFTITGMQDIDLISEGSFIQIDDEFMEVSSISGNQFTVVRGILDTVPESHLAGSRLFGVGDFHGSDLVEYTLSENVKVRLTPSTPKGTLDVNLAPEDTVNMTGRLQMPYPPANVKVDNSYWPATVVDGYIDLTWATRNRIQQTAATFNGFYTGDITTEPGVTYSATLKRTDNQDLIASFSGETGTSRTIESYYAGEVELSIWSVRDGFNSWQTVTHTFEVLSGVPVVNDAYVAGGKTTVNVDTIYSFSFSIGLLQTTSAVLTVARRSASGGSSTTKGYAAGGNTGSYSDEIDGIDFSTETSINPTAVLPMTRSAMGSVQSGTKAYFTGGYNGAYRSRIDRFIFSTEVSEYSGSVLTDARYGMGGVESSTKGYIAGGYTSAYATRIDGVLFADDTALPLITHLATGKVYPSSVVDKANGVGYFGGGRTGTSTNTNVVEKFTFSSETVGSTSAVLSSSRQQAAGIYSATIGYSVGGNTSASGEAMVTTIDELTFSTETSAVSAMSLPTATNLQASLQKQ